jgi:diguanylate cyclase (GGDEF)-like protein
VKYTGRIFSLGYVLLISISIVSAYLFIPRLLFGLVTLFLLFAWYFGKKYDQQKFRADKDFLTNAYSRRVIFEVFPKLKKESSDLIIMMLDIDNFKFINDQFGHDVGDIVLQKVAHLLVQNTRKKWDRAIRWGGDEFILLLSLDAKKEAHKIIEHLERGFQKLSEEMNMEIRSSMGFTFCNPSTQSITDLIRTADLNMYQHKNGKKTELFG